MDVSGQWRCLYILVHHKTNDNYNTLDKDDSSVSDTGILGKQFCVLPSAVKHMTSLLLVWMLYH